MALQSPPAVSIAWAIGALVPTVLKLTQLQHKLKMAELPVPMPMAPLNLAEHHV